MFVHCFVQHLFSLLTKARVTWADRNYGRHKGHQKRWLTCYWCQSFMSAHV